MKNAVGRPTKLNKKIQDELVDLIEKGNFMNCAAQSIGIDESTVYLWINRGKKETERVDAGNQNCKYKKSERLYVNFYRAIEKASAVAEMKALAIIIEAGKTDWRASCWFLEHRFPSRWGNKQRHEVTGENGQPIEVNIEEIRAKLMQKLENISKSE